MDRNPDKTARKTAEGALPKQRPAAGRTAALDEQGFDQIRRDYGDRLVRNLTGFVRDRDKAEDIAAQAFQTAWEKREKFRGDSRASTWIEAIARNEARRSYSRDRVARFDSIDGPEARELAAPELVTDELEKRDDQLRLQNALAQLPVKYRRALTAHFVDGLSIRAIALNERVPLGTVLSRISSGKQLLREAWSRSAQPEAARNSRSLDPRERKDSPALGSVGYNGAESPDMSLDR